MLRIYRKYKLVDRIARILAVALCVKYKDTGSQMTTDYMTSEPSNTHKVRLNSGNDTPRLTYSI